MLAFLEVREELLLALFLKRSGVVQQSKLDELAMDRHLANARLCLDLLPCALVCDCEYPDAVDLDDVLQRELRDLRLSGTRVQRDEWNPELPRLPVFAFRVGVIDE